MSNFEFLKGRDRLIAQLTRQAEAYVYTDPQSCMFKLRLMVEVMAKRLVQMYLPELVSEDLAVMLARLERTGRLDRSSADVMHAIRRDGNQAVHGGRTPPATAVRRLRDAHGLSKWYVRSLGDGQKIRTGPFVPPPKPADAGEHPAQREAEALEDRIEAERARTRQALMLYRDTEEAAVVNKRMHQELEGLAAVAAAAGEPLVDADSVMLIMALEIEQLLEHPHLGMTTREAKAEAERQFDAARQFLEQREVEYLAQREAIADELEIEAD